MAGGSYIGLALICGICMTGALGGSLIKLSSDASRGSLSLLALAICVYSLSSLGVFYLYKSGAAENFALTTFSCLLGTLLCSQIASFWIGETFNARAFLVLTVAICAFAWATQTPGYSKSTPQSNFPKNGDTP